MPNKSREDWKGKFQQLEGRFQEIDDYKKEARKFNSKIIGIEAIHAIVALLLVVITFKQCDILDKQNNLIDRQNIIQQQQTYLSEATLRSSLGDDKSNILNDYFDDLKTLDTISNRTIARMTGFSIGLVPYKLFVNDSLTIKPYSPEKTHLLTSIIFSQPDTISWEKIKRNVPFSNMYINDYSMRNFDLSNGRFGDSQFQNCQFDDSDLSYTYFSDTNFSKSRFNNCKLIRTWAPDSDVTNSRFFISNLDHVMFGGSNFQNATFDSCTIHQTVFDGADLRGAKFHKTKLIDCIMLETKIYKSQIDELKECGITDEQIDQLKIY